MYKRGHSRAGQLLRLRVRSLVRSLLNLPRLGWFPPLCPDVRCRTSGNNQLGSGRDWLRLQRSVVRGTFFDNSVGGGNVRLRIRGAGRAPRAHHCVVSDARGTFLMIAEGERRGRVFAAAPPPPPPPPAPFFDLAINSIIFMKCHYPNFFYAMAAAPGGLLVLKRQHRSHILRFFCTKLWWRQEQQQRQQRQQPRP